MRNKSLLIMSIVSIIIFCSTIISYFIRPSVLAIIAITIELICSIVLLRSWIKESHKNILWKIPRITSFKVILKNIPGFRSREKSNMVIASIYYCFCIIFLILSLIFFQKGAKVAVSALVIPLMLFATMDYMNNK